MSGRPPAWGTSFPGGVLPTVEREIDALRSELSVHDGAPCPVVGMFRRYLDLLERDGFLLRDRDRFEIRRLLQRAQGRVTSTAVFLTGVVAMILGVGAACILMDCTAAALGPASFLAGVLVGAVITGTVMRVGTRELNSWTAHLADTAMASLDERLP